jgi:hypothetical protein
MKLFFFIGFPWFRALSETGVDRFESEQAGVADSARG